MAVKKSEAYFRAITENSSDIIFVVNARGTITYASPSVERLVGYRPDELIGKSGFDLILPEDNPRAIEDFARALQTKDVVIPNAFRIRHKDGTERIMEGVGKNLLDNPIVAGFVMNIRDITDRKVVEAALRQSETKYRAIFENATEGIFQINLDGAFLSVNRAFARIFGYTSPEELLYGIRHVKHEVYAHPEDRDRIRRLLAETGQIRGLECEFIDRYGKKIWVAINAHNISDAKGCILHYEGTVADISERKLMEQKLLEAKDKLDEAQRIGRIGSWEYDLATGAMWYSDEMCHIAGCDPNQGPFDLETSLQRVHWEDREGVAKALEAAVTEMKPYDLSHRIVSPDGSERIIHSRGRVFCDSQGQPTRMAGITQDITKEKILERQVMHQEKLASLGMLVSGIAHEINNPNNFITFNIPILRDYIRELMRIADAYADQHPDYELFGMTYSEFREDIFNLIDNIEHGTGRIDGTVRKLQEFSRKKNGEERRLADVEEIVGQAVAICSSQIGRIVKAFEVEVAPGLPPMLTDADALEQILINILINASHAADKEESRIALRVVGGASWENRVIIEIEDNGAGMDQATQNSIFNPFFTTKPRGKGTGLGLYIVNNLIESLGGAIEVESEPGRGSLFRIILPELNIYA